MKINLGSGFFLTNQDLPEGYSGVFLFSEIHPPGKQFFATDQIVATSGFVVARILVDNLIKQNSIHLDGPGKTLYLQFMDADASSVPPPPLSPGGMRLL